MNTANTISAIWQGSARHRRFRPRALHAFSHSLFALGLDLDEVTRGRYKGQGPGQGALVRYERAGLLSFYRQDYLKGSSAFKQAVAEGRGARRRGHPRAAGVAAGQCALSGLYFEANFYFHTRGVLVTCWPRSPQHPWNERHYYLLDLAALAPHDKNFHCPAVHGLGHALPLLASST